MAYPSNSDDAYNVTADEIRQFVERTDNSISSMRRASFSIISS